MSVDAISFAKRNAKLNDYRNFCNIAKAEIGKSYYDRIRVLDFLIDEKLIRIVDGALNLSNQVLPDWVSELATSESKIWKLIDSFEFDENRIMKFDQEINNQIGLQGEEYFLTLLSNNFSESNKLKLIHVSKTDDSAGYDIVAPNLISPEYLDFWEVKTSVIPNEFFRFYITRNEFNSSIKYGNWKLVAINRIESEFTALGYLTADDLSQLIPIDSIKSTKWTVQQITLPKTRFRNLEL